MSIAETLNIKDFISFDISTVIAGTSEVVPIGDIIYGRICGIQINQNTINEAGVTFRLVESIDGSGWVDVLEDDEDAGSTIELVSATNTETIVLASDLVTLKKYGVLIDVPAARTGTLEIYGYTR